jgi:hypothetical protein
MTPENYTHHRGDFHTPPETSIRCGCGHDEEIDDLFTSETCDCPEVDAVFISCLDDMELLHTVSSEDGLTWWVKCLYCGNNVTSKFLKNAGITEGHENIKYEQAEQLIEMLKMVNRKGKRG